MTQLRCRIRLDPQRPTVRMAEDVDPHAVLRGARLTSLVVTKRGETRGEVERKGKRIAPQKEVLRLTPHVLLDPAEGAIREFLLSAFQFYLDYRSNGRSSVSLNLGTGSLEISSTVIGLAVLALSFWFLLTYVERVYSIEVFEMPPIDATTFGVS